MQILEQHRDLEAGRRSVTPRIGYRADVCADSTAQLERTFELYEGKGWATE